MCTFCQKAHSMEEESKALWTSNSMKELDEWINLLKVCNDKLQRTLESRKDSGTVETQDLWSGLRTDGEECVNTCTPWQGNKCIRKSILAAAGLAMGGNIHGFGLLIDNHPPKGTVSINHILTIVDRCPKMARFTSSGYYGYSRRTFETKQNRSRAANPKA